MTDPGARDPGAARAAPQGPVVLSVADLDRRLRRLVEDGVRNTWVVGEVGDLKSAASGHVYFTLKDEREPAIVSCVMYRTEALRFARHLRLGAKVEARGTATFYPPSGRLQLVVDAARPRGEGARDAALRELRARLQEEGLFAPSRKRSLPTDPRLVGVVTSREGAAIHDIARVAFRRGSVRILLAHASVQGDAAPLEIVRAIDKLERVPGLSCLVVGRGGGASDDLSAFNDERVVRRVAAARVPVVSAVGHEVDVTLVDLAADVRAATPSQAAELLVRETRSQVDRLASLDLRLRRAMRSRVVEDRIAHERLARVFADGRHLVDRRRTDVDDLFDRITTAVRAQLTQARRDLLSLEARRAARHPRAVLAERRAQLGPLLSRLVAAETKLVAGRRASVGRLVGSLDALSPLAVLSRGYALVTDVEGRALTQTAAVPPGSPFVVRLADGTFRGRRDP